MLRIIACMVVLAGLTGPSFADDAREVARENAMESIQAEMYVAYICRPDVGDGYYAAAQTMGERTLESLGETPEDASLQIGKYDKFIASRATKQPNDGLMDGLKSPQQRQAFCMATITGTQRAAAVTAAKARRTH